MIDDAGRRRGGWEGVGGWVWRSEDGGRCLSRLILTDIVMTLI